MASQFYDIAIGLWNELGHCLAFGHRGIWLTSTHRPIVRNHHVFAFFALSPCIAAENDLLFSGIRVFGQALEVREDRQAFVIFLRDGVDRDVTVDETATSRELLFGFGAGLLRGVINVSSFHHPRHVNKETLRFALVVGVPTNGHD